MKNIAFVSFGNQSKKCADILVKSIKKIIQIVKLFKSQQKKTKM